MWLARIMLFSKLTILFSRVILSFLVHKFAFQTLLTKHFPFASVFRSPGKEEEHSKDPYRTILARFSFHENMTCGATGS